jgi:peptidoglycan/xylan/chitin deacetylase (PgdA/CDA1 family)
MVLSLAYEGLQVEDLRRALRVLDERGWRVTFFANPTAVLDCIVEWRALAGAGHEIGNGALGGVTLSGDLVNWTTRMVEQDLHMTQTFLEDTFGDAAVPIFLFPGRNSRSADGDYRTAVEGQFEFAVLPEDYEGEAAHSKRLNSPQSSLNGTGWEVLRGPDFGSEAFQMWADRVAETGAELVPLYEAALRFRQAGAP